MVVTLAGPISQALREREKIIGTKSDVPRYKVIAKRIVHFFRKLQKLLTK